LTDKLTIASPPFLCSPFLIDLESSNGSYVNDTEIPTSRYYQLRTGDTLTFGASTREYVLLDESAA
jgi:smad nuclear-interacting protein 1